MFYLYNIHHHQFLFFLYAAIIIFKQWGIRSWPAFHFLFTYRKIGQRGEGQIFAYLFFFIYLSIDFFFASSIVFHSCFFLNPRLPKKKKWKNWFFFFAFFQIRKHFTFESFLSKKFFFCIFHHHHLFFFEGRKIFFLGLCVVKVWGFCLRLWSCFSHHPISCSRTGSEKCKSRGLVAMPNKTINIIIFWKSFYNFNFERFEVFDNFDIFDSWDKKITFWRN